MWGNALVWHGKRSLGGDGDPAGHGPWMAMWVMQAHRELVGGMGATGFGLVPQRSKVGAVPGLH